MRTKKIAYCGVLTSLTLILSYFERMLPPPIPIPGVKFGLANIVILISLYILTEKEATYIMLLKAFLVGFLFSGITGILFGLLGGTLSLVSMFIAKRTNLFSIVGVSMVGGVMFNIGQILANYILISTLSIFYYLPILLFFGLVSGSITGFVSYFVINTFKKANIISNSKQ